MTTSSVINVDMTLRVVRGTYIHTDKRTDGQVTRVVISRVALCNNKKSTKIDLVIVKEITLQSVEFDLSYISSRVFDETLKLICSVRLFCWGWLYLQRKNR